MEGLTPHLNPACDFDLLMECEATTFDVIDECLKHAGCLIQKQWLELYDK